MWLEIVYVERKPYITVGTIELRFIFAKKNAIKINVIIYECIVLNRLYLCSHIAVFVHWKKVYLKRNE